MAASILRTLPILWLFLATCAWGGTPVTTDPVVPLERVAGQTVYNYPVTYTPIVAGTITFEYFTSLAKKPYCTYVKDSTKGPYTVSAATTFPVYVRITVTAADGSIPTQYVIWYLNPPSDPKPITPHAPTGFTVARR